MTRLLARYRIPLLALFGLAVLGFIALQFADRFVEDWQRSNPPVTASITWDSPETEQLMRAACYDCHSNETVWPWYTYIAPVSWFTANHVNDGRDGLNLSDPTQWTPANYQDMIDHIEDGDMPLPAYILLHPDANLTPEQREQLIVGIERTFDYVRGSVDSDMADMEMPQATPEP
ncbi:MAG: heme-binding domain-containing protein [Chloroflexi bacterium]|nr:heme-binding domain-containing protein [Chloroflexota bacterium]